MEALAIARRARGQAACAPPQPGSATLRLLDRYLLAELIRPFGFFALVFTGVIWLTQSLRVIDTVVNSGQGAGLFLEFSGLLLPFVMTVVLPIACFGASLYVANRVASEAELAAAMSGGASRPRLARPFLIFGLSVGVATLLATTWLSPMAAREMRDRVAELRGDIASALLFEGRFLHPSDGLTIYIRENRDGALAGVFVADRRDPDNAIVYTARQATLSAGEDGPKLVMFDGAAQRDEPGGGLSLLRFDRFGFDLGQFMQAVEGRRVKPSERSALELIRPGAELLARDPLGKLYAEGHEQLSAPLYAPALALIGFAAVTSGGYARSGYAKRVALGAASGVALRLSGLGMKALTTGAASAWPLMYLPPLIGLAAAFWLLARGR